MLHRELGHSAAPYLIALHRRRLAGMPMANGSNGQALGPPAELPRNCRMSGALTANRERRQAKRERARRRSAQSQRRVYALTITTIRIRGQNHDHPWLVTPPERPRWPKRPRQLAPFRPLA